MISILKDIFQWFKNPDEERLDISQKEKMILLSKVLLLDFAVAMLFSGIVYAIDRYVLKFESTMMHMDLFALIVFVIFIVPFFEELIFRFPLKYQRNYIARGIDYISNDWLKKNWDKFRKYFFYFMMIAFGYVHISNFDNLTPLHYVLGIVMIGSQLFGGVTISYIRLKLGFLWGVIQHFLFNGTLIAISLIFSHQKPIIDFQNDYLDIKIEKLVYTDEDESSLKVKADEDKIFSIQGNDTSLGRLFKELNLDTEPLEDNWIDINFESKNGLSKDKFIEILEKEIEMR